MIRPSMKHIRRAALPLAALLLGACNSANAPLISEDNSKVDQPNIIVILSDDIRLDDLGAYGGGYLTPSLNKLAAEGVRFENAYCPTAACTPSRFSVLTGKYPGRCEDPNFAPDVDEPYNVTWNSFVTEEEPTISAYLNEAGYYTGMTGKWHVSPHIDNSRFPKIDPKADLDDPETSELLKQHQQVLVDEVRLRGKFDFAASILEGNAPRFPVDELKAHHLEWITKGALDFLDTAPADQPFFLYLAPTAVHSPSHDWTLDKDWVYTPGGKLTEEQIAVHPPRETVRTRLEEAGLPVEHRSVGLLMMDDMINTITTKLETMGVEEETLIIFIGDHGVEPGKLVCYDEGVRTPMFVKWPGYLEPGTSTGEMAMTVDIAATAIEVAGMSQPEDADFDGVPFLQRDVDGVRTSRKYAYFENGYTRGVSDGKFKYITLRFPSGLVDQMQSGEIEMAPNHANMPGQEQPYISMQCYPDYYDHDQLYYLPTDPYEQQNMIGEEQFAEDLDRLKNALRNQLAEMQRPYPLEETAFYETTEYEELAHKHQSLKLEGQPWWWMVIDRFKSKVAEQEK